MPVVDQTTGTPEHPFHVRPAQGSDGYRPPCRRAVRRPASASEKQTPRPGCRSWALDEFQGYRHDRVANGLLTTHRHAHLERKGAVGAQKQPPVDIEASRPDCRHVAEIHRQGRRRRVSSASDRVPEPPMTTMSPSRDSTLYEVTGVMVPKGGTGIAKALSQVEPTPTAFGGQQVHPLRPLAAERVLAQHLVEHGLPDGNPAWAGSPFLARNGLPRTGNLRVSRARRRIARSSSGHTARGRGFSSY